MPLTSIVSIGRRAISRPEQLRGKTVGTAGIPYQSAYLKAILDRAGVDRARRCDEVNVGFNLVPAMLSRKVDATLGAFWNYEAIQLRLQRKRPKVIRMEQAGVPTYNELVIVAREDDVRERRRADPRASCARCPRASRRCATTRPAASTRCCGQPRPRPAACRRASVKATLPVFFPADEARSRSAG